MSSGRLRTRNLSIKRPPSKGDYLNCHDYFLLGGTEAATAIVSVTSLTGTGSAHINLLMSGIFDVGDDDDADAKNANAGVVAKFEWSDDNGTIDAVFEDISISKLNNVSIAQEPFSNRSDRFTTATIGLRGLGLMDRVSLLANQEVHHGLIELHPRVCC